MNADVLNVATISAISPSPDSGNVHLLNDRIALTGMRYEVFRTGNVLCSAWLSSRHPFAAADSHLIQEPVDSDIENQLVQYLKRKEAVFSKFHPQWDLTNEDISSSSDLLKRDGTPICIPPSWDLVQKFAGPDDERTDGFDGNIFKKELRLFTGDRSEAEFLDVMRNLEIGGILIGDIDSKELLNINFCINEDFVIYSPKLYEFLKYVGYFQIDFLHFHKSGIFHFEIKTIRREKDDDKQLQRNKDILKKLFVTFCQMIKEENAAELWDNNYFCQSSIFYVNEPCEEDSNATSGEKTISSKIWGKEKLKEFWSEESNFLPSKNLFKDKIYRNFLLFLAGFRPDFFICPVKCALFLQKNIFSNRVNAVNYYRKGDDEDKIQNNAKTVSEFLQKLKFVKNVEIDFGEYKNIYLTPQQQEAVGVFDEGGNFSPKRQFIVGPPGSGKSLILMLKIFILGQMEKRKKKKVYYWSPSGHHTKKLTDFVSRNKSKFCREMKKFGWIYDWKTVACEGADVILDEESRGSRALSCLSSQHEDQIVALVCTGWWGSVTSRNHRNEHNSIDAKKFESMDFVITELQTVFRSTRQIQKYFHEFNDDENKRELISGHNFDGIKVEEWIFDGREKLKKGLEERIERLIQIEGCEGREIGLFPPGGYEKPQIINSIFHDFDELRSLEFPVMIVVEPREFNGYLSLSRAVCHLICFTTKSSERIRARNFASSTAEVQSM